MAKLPMIGGDFVRLVEAMRAAQVRFFSTKDRSALKEAQRLERLVDSMVAVWAAQVVQVEIWQNELQTDDEKGAYEVEHLHEED